MSVHRVGQEDEYRDVVLTSVKRKPPTWLMERADTSGEVIRCVLRKGPKGRTEWVLLLPAGGIYTFKTRRQALDFYCRLTVLESARNLPPRWWDE